MDTFTKKSVSALRAELGTAADPVVPRPSRSEAEQAVRTLLAYIGDDPDREGLRDTPKRVISAYEELYSGYREDAVEVLDRTFAEMGTYDDLVLVRNIPFHSHCEHHMMPFYGRAHVAYLPIERVVGLSKLARLIDVYARRLQTQEHLTSQVVTAIDEVLEAARRRGDDRGRAHLHVAARRREARLVHGDDPVQRPVPRRPHPAGALHHPREGLTVSRRAARRRRSRKASPSPPNSMRRA